MKNADPREESLSRSIEGNRHHQQRCEGTRANVRSVYEIKQSEPYDCSVPQEPYASVLSCSDSRVIPENIFNAGEGDLFLARLAGNVADTSSTASLEYSVHVLKVPLIIVLGHECCGAVDAAIKMFRHRSNPAYGNLGYNLNHLLSNIIPAINVPEENDLVAATKRNAINAGKMLKDRSEIIRVAVADGRLYVVSAYYHLGGHVEFLQRIDDLGTTDLA